MNEAYEIFEETMLSQRFVPVLDKFSSFITVLLRKMLTNARALELPLPAERYLLQKLSDMLA